VHVDDVDNPHGYLACPIALGGSADIVRTLASDQEQAAQPSRECCDSWQPEDRPWPADDNEVSMAFGRFAADGASGPGRRRISRSKPYSDALIHGQAADRVEEPCVVMWRVVNFGDGCRREG
jgi:hypothetical protein